jgi:hypothetical protein
VRLLEDYEGLGVRLLKDYEGLQMEIWDMNKSMMTDQIYIY